MLLENCPYPRDARVRREALTLTEAGLSVTVICPNDGSQAWSDEVNRVRVMRYPAPPAAGGFVGYFFEYGYSLIAAAILSLLALVRGGFDVVHAHNPPDLFVLIGAFYKVFGKKFVFDHHDLSPELYDARFQGGGNPRVRASLEFFEKLSCRLADRVITTNESQRRSDVSRGGADPNQVVVVRNGPDLDRFGLTEPHPRISRHPGPVLGYVGEIGYQDGLDYLVDAVDCLVREQGRTDALAVVVGDGDALTSVREKTSKLGLRSNFWFTGRVAPGEVSRFLSGADICVDPDPSNPYNDGCSMIKLTEYMALSKPIVAFDLPENRVTAGRAALYAEANSPADLARKIATLLDDQRLIAEMGAAGRRRIERSLGWSHQARPLRQVYDTLLPGRLQAATRRQPAAESRQAL